MRSSFSPLSPPGHAQAKKSGTKKAAAAAPKKSKKAAAAAAAADAAVASSSSAAAASPLDASLKRKAEGQASDAPAAGSRRTRARS